MAAMNKIHSLTVSLEANVNNYVMNITNAIPPELADNVKSIRAWVDKQVEAGDKASKVKNIEKTLQGSIAAINNLRNANYMEGALKIVGTVAPLVGGPYGALAGAVCGMLSSVLSTSSPNQNDLGTQLSIIVQDELKNFSQEQRINRFNGLQRRVTQINLALKNIREKAKREPSLWWMSVESENPCKELKIPDENLFYSDFPQFIGEEDKTLEEGLTLVSKEGKVKNCIASLVSYCKAMTLYMTVLTNVLTTLEMTGHDTKNILELLELQKNDARLKLSMRVDKGIPSQRGRLAMFYHLRNNAIAYKVVGCFRSNLGMTPIPDPHEARRYAEVAANEMPVDISIGYPQPEKKSKGHHFQFINHTEYPIKICCFATINNLRNIEIDILAYHSEERAIQGILQPPLGVPWLVAAQMVLLGPLAVVGHFIDFGSAWGYFIIYLDGDLKSSQDRFSSRSCRVFEFALSNSGISSKINVTDKSTNITDASGEECEKQTTDDKPPPLFFNVGKSHYVVYAKIKEDDNKKFKSWCFVVQKYDASDWSISLMKRLQRN